MSLYERTSEWITLRVMLVESVTHTLTLKGWVILDIAIYSWPYEKHILRKPNSRRPPKEGPCALFVIKTKHARIGNWVLVKPETGKFLSPGPHGIRGRHGGFPWRHPVATRRNKRVLVKFSKTYLFPLTWPSEGSNFLNRIAMKPFYNLSLWPSSEVPAMSL